MADLSGETQVYFSYVIRTEDRLCGLVVTVLGCRHRGLGFDSRWYRIFGVAVGLERDPLSPCDDK
jgi:hypothetical protein